jgi:hypothetical protein
MLVWGWPDTNVDTNYEVVMPATRSRVVSPKEEVEGSNPFGSALFSWIIKILAGG